MLKVNDIVTILAEPEDSINRTARVVHVAEDKGGVCVSNMNQPFQGTLAGAFYLFSEVEKVGVTEYAPKITDNARLLCGYLVGCVRPKAYKAVEVRDDFSAMVFENVRTGTRFLVSVRQIAGEE